MDKVLRVENIEFLLTNNCNMRCKYCFEGSHVEDRGSVDPEKVKQFLESNGARNFYVFGGEPLLKLNELEEIINFVKSNEKFLESRRQSLLTGLRKITSNATLISRKNIEKIKDLGLNFQISLDGHKEANDFNRVFSSGKGTFNRVMESIELLEEYEIPWSIHGVLNMKNSLEYQKIIDFFYNLYKKHKGTDQAINYFQGNFSMFVFEEDFTDEYIDLFLEELERTADWIMRDESFNDLSIEQRERLFKNVIVRQGVGGACGVGRGLKTSDDNYNIHPCHRLVVREDTILGNMFDNQSLKNIGLYNNLRKMVHNRRMYSTHFQVLPKDYNTIRWWMYCPATNIETSNNPRFVNASYSVLIAELNRFTKFLEMKYLSSL